MVIIRISPTTNGLTYRVTFRYNATIVAVIKALPQRSRRWDKRAGVWRVRASHIPALTDRLEIEGHTVINDRTPVSAG